MTDMRLDHSGMSRDRCGLPSDRRASRGVSLLHRLVDRSGMALVGQLYG